MSEFDPYHIWLGIPETARPISKYRLLGIDDFEADRVVISAAAERQTLYLRTLQSGEYEVLVAELLNEVSQARVTLLNADQKAEYDEQLRKQQTPEPELKPAPILVKTLEPSPIPVSIVQPTKKPRRKVQKEIWKRPTVIGIALLGAIAAFVLFISMMLSGDTDPVVRNFSPVVTSPLIPKIMPEPKPTVNPLLYLKWRKEASWVPGEIIAEYLLGDKINIKLSPPITKVIIQAYQASQTLYLKGIEVRELFSDSIVFARNSKTLDINDFTIGTGGNGAVSLQQNHAIILKANGGWAQLTLKIPLPEYFQVKLTLNHPSRTGWEIVYLRDFTSPSAVEIFRTESDRSHNGDFETIVIRDPLETYSIRAEERTGYSRATVQTVLASNVSLTNKSNEVFSLDGRKIRLRKEKLVSNVETALPIQLTVETEGKQQINYQINKNQTISYPAPKSLE
jgi:hypothetical protein